MARSQPTQLCCTSGVFLVVFTWTAPMGDVFIRVPAERTQDPRLANWG